MIEKTEGLKSINFVDEIKVLFVVGNLSGTTLLLDVTTIEECFRVENGFAGSIHLIAKFIY